MNFQQSGLRGGPMSTAEKLSIDYAAMTSRQMIAATLNTFCSGNVIELRCLGVGRNRNRTDSGYFSDFNKAAAMAERYVRDNCTRGVYFVLNLFAPELLARAANRFEEYAKTTTANDAITSRNWLYIDCDPVRPAGISATEGQVTEAHRRAADVSEALKSYGLCEPIVAMSGNGAHLHLPINLPNDAEHEALVKGVLRTLSAQFSDKLISIDQTVSNAARICRLYGTIARKGDNTADRPHRMARLLHVPDYIQRKTGDVCDVEALRAVAAMSEPSTKAGSRAAASPNQSVWPDRRLIVPDYLRSVGATFREKTKGEFTNYVLDECPFNPAHKSPDSYVTQGSRGGVSFKCSHNSCAHQNWQTLQLHWGKPRSEHWDPPYSHQSTPEDTAVPRFLEGERVRSSDRGNIGTVVCDDGGPNVRVEFVGKDGVATLDKPRSMLSNLDGSKGASVIPLVLDPFSAWDLIHMDTPLDEEIIKGILRVGEVANVIASTKFGKSWLAVGLAFAVATGSNWLGRKTLKGNVLLIDNELRPRTLKHRIATVMRAMGIEPSQGHARLEVVSLRGQSSNIQSLELALKKYNRDEFGLIILDAKYRAFGELDENSNTDQTLFHNAVDKIAGDLNAGFLMVHHSTKGDQGGRSVTDVGSGGGSQSRAVDTHLIIRPHSNEGCAVLDAAVRSFPPVESQTLRYEFPLWHLAAAVEPVLKAEKTRGDSSKEAKDMKALGEITQILHDANEPMTRYQIHHVFGGGKDRVNRLIFLGITKNRIVQVGTRKARNGEEAEIFMVASRADVSVNSDEEKNGLF